MKTYWIIFKGEDVYGVYEDKFSAIKEMNTYIEKNFTGVPKAIAKNMLKVTEARNNGRISIGNNFYAEEWRGIKS
jgi:hypothetical protein